jgi:hypothetical protein
MKEWLRPARPGQAKAHLRTVVAAQEATLAQYSQLDWMPLAHLTSAATVLEEAQRVAGYSQIFAFYLGCVPVLEAAGPDGRIFGLTDDQSGFRGRLYSDTDPRSLDAEMFYRNLEQLEVALHALSTELLVTVEVLLLIRLWAAGQEEAVRAHAYDGKWSIGAAQATVQSRRSDVMDRVRICQQRKDAMVALMEEGFGERVWSFRAVKE